MNVDEGVLFNANEGFIQYRPELEERVATKVPLLIKELINVTEGQVLFSRKEFEEKYQVLPELSIPYGSWWFFPLILLSSVLIGIPSGIYPSLFLSSFKPIQVLKGKLSRGSSNARLKSA